jgi:putative transcriptional regulator
MAVKYNKLFKLMIDRKMSTSELRKQAGFSANIITKLKRDEYLSLDSVEKICRAMNCGVDEILKFVPDNNEGGNGNR